MKKVGIDARLFYQTGVGVYLRNLIFYLNKLNPKDIDFIVFVLKEDLNMVKKKYTKLKFIGVTSKWHTLSEQIIFLIDTLKYNLDLMHFTYFSFPVLYSKTYVSTIHDTTPLNFKTGKASTKSNLIYLIKHKIFRYIFNKQILNSKIIITPTKTIKDELINLYPSIKRDKIKPIYEGVTFEYLNNVKDKSKLISKNKYFLYVGTFYPHKNVEALIEAFSYIKEKVSLYLVGPDDFFSKNIIKLIDKYNLNTRVKIIKNVTQEELSNYYREALALIHPSKSEGFGLPLIEAVYFNLPIIASNIKVFKEILKNEFVDFNPYNVKDIASKINLFLKKGKKYNYDNLIKTFNYESMTYKTLEIYKGVLYK